MADHPNATMIRDQMDAMERGDWDTVNAMLADDVVWHEIGSDEPVRGKRALADRMGAAGDVTITGKLHDVVANDEHAIALVEATATRDGRTFTYRTAEIMHVRDGKVVERWAFSDDTAAINAFFG